MPAATRLAAALAALVVAAPLPARACSICACGDPLAAAGGSPGMAGALRLSLEGEWLRARAGSEEAAGATDVVTQSTLRLGAAWSPLDRVNLVLQVPLLRKEMGQRVAGATQPVSDVTGVGDVEVGARWFLLDRADLGARRAQSLAVSLGAALPTGANGVTAAGARLDEHAQPGTGAYGPVAGLLYRLGQGHLSLLASVAGRVRTENGAGYRYGPALLWSVLGEWDVSRRVTVALGLDGREAWPDREEGAAVEHTGGLVLAAVPALSVGLSDELFLTARAQLPVVARLRGDQSVDPTVLAGVQWLAF